MFLWGLASCIIRQILGQVLLELEQYNNILLQVEMVELYDNWVISQLLLASPSNHLWACRTKIDYSLKDSAT